MNSYVAGEVNRLLAGLAMVSLVAQAACVEVDGGALEGAWVVNVADKGVRIDCACGQMASVAFSLTPWDAQGRDPCEGDGEGEAARCRFDCGDGVGTTRFFIPEGRYAISMVPVGLDGVSLAAESGVVYPAPVVRDVRKGELTSLGVSLFIVARSRLAGPDKCEAGWLEPP